MQNDEANAVNNIDALEPTPHFIALFDILGYKDKIGKYGENAAKLARIIDDHIKMIKRSTYKLDLDTMKYVEGEIRLKAFSDNILLCTNTNWAALCSLVAILQGRMAEDGLFIRGVICHGQLCFESEFICGQGLVLAYEIESKIAIYPRIILHQTYLDAINKDILEKGKLSLPEYEYIGAVGAYSHFWCDFDGYKVLDYLLLANELAPYQDKPNNIIEKHKAEIIKILTSDPPPSERVRQKFLWSKNYHNCYIDRAVAMGHPIGEHYICDSEIGKNCLR